MNIFDLLGDPNIELRYPSVMLYKIDDLVPHRKHHLVVKLEPLDNASDYKFDLGTFSNCSTISNQLISILKESDAVLKYIVNHTEKKYIEMFDIDRLSVKLENGMKLVLHYNGLDASIQKNVFAAPNYGFVSRIVFDNGDADNEDGDDDEENEDDDLKNVLDELVLESSV